MQLRWVETQTNALVSDIRAIQVIGNDARCANLDCGCSLRAING